MTGGRQWWEKLTDQSCKSNGVLNVLVVRTIATPNLSATHFMTNFTCLRVNDQVGVRVNDIICIFNIFNYVGGVKFMFMRQSKHNALFNPRSSPSALWGTPQCFWETDGFSHSSLPSGAFWETGPRPVKWHQTRLWLLHINIVIHCMCSAWPVHLNEHHRMKTDYIVHLHLSFCFPGKGLLIEHVRTTTVLHSNCASAGKHKYFTILCFFHPLLSV